MGSEMCIRDSPTISDKGRKRISYALDDLKVRGSKLHNASFPKLIKERGLDFDLNRDKAAMDAVAKGKKITVAPNKLIDWSGIDLVGYLPSALHNDIQIEAVEKTKHLEIKSSQELLIQKQKPKYTKKKSRGFEL